MNQTLESNSNVCHVVFVCHLVRWTGEVLYYDGHERYYGDHARYYGGQMGHFGGHIRYYDERVRYMLTCPFAHMTLEINQGHSH